MKSRAESQISDLYVARFGSLTESYPPGVNAGRREAMEAFSLLGLPTRKDEEYRHIELTRAFDPMPSMAEPGNNIPMEAIPAEGIHLILNDGYFMPETELSRTERGVCYGSLRTALSGQGTAGLAEFNSVADTQSDVFTALGGAFMKDGVYICVPEGITETQRFIIDLRYSSGRTMCFPRILIGVGNGASVDVCIIHRSDDESNILIDSVSEIILGREARLNLSYIERLGSGTTFIDNNYIRQADCSEVRSTSLWAGNGLCRVNSSVTLDGPGADHQLNGLFIGTGDRVTDINLYMGHNVPRCTSSQLVKGIVTDSAQGAFTGKVYVAPDAQQTAAFQQSRNLQMSEGSRIYTEPRLEIYADDVKCSHGATVGQLDDDAIYYMRQRGIGLKNARRLQLYGFVNDIVSRCEQGDICDYINGIARDKINEL